MKAFITFAILLAGIVSMIAATNPIAAFAEEKKVKVDIDIDVNVKNKKGDKGDPGAPGAPGVDGQDGADSTVPGPTGPQGPAGNVNVNICQEGTSNCVSETVEAGNNLTIFINASGQVSEEPEVPPTNDTGGEVPTNDTGGEVPTNDTGGEIPPIDTGGNDTGTGGNDTGTDVNGTTTEPICAEGEFLNLTSGQCEVSALPPENDTGTDTGNGEFENATATFSIDNLFNNVVG